MPDDYTVSVTDTDETLRAKKNGKLRERQRQLNWLLREDTIEWEKVNVFVFGDLLDPNVQDPTTLVETSHLAAYAGENDVLRWCLATKADINARTTLGRSVLHYACDGNRTRSMRTLLEQKADANIRTLGQLTPLHLLCQNGLYDATLVLLHESHQVIDIDAEDSKRRTPEMLTQDKRIHRALRKYRAEFDEKRKNALIDQCLQRLFNLFDTNGDNYIFPEEWAETQTMLAEHFENHCDDNIEEIFTNADKNNDGRIDFEEFKLAHHDMLDALGVSHREIMHSLCDIERAIFQERIRIQTGQEKEVNRPVVSPRARALSMKHSHVARRTPTPADDDSVTGA